MLKVPRERFVPSDVAPQAYADRPLPIGYGQTISQPFIVAYMTEALQVTNNKKVLDLRRSATATCACARATDTSDGPSRRCSMRSW
jgi:hypothetical protein